jgi:exosortase
MTGKNGIVHKASFRIGLIGLLLAVLYHRVILDLAHDWIVDENYSHGFLIPLVSGYMIWRRRKRIRGLPGGSCGAGLVLILGGLLLFMAAGIAAEYFTQRLSLLIVIGGLVLYLGGRRVARETAFPLIYLLFMIPVPYVIYYSVSFPLELLASRLTVAVVGLLDIPIVRSGNILQLESTTLQVVDACSGLRSLISLSALAAAMAYLTQRRVVSGIILFLASVPVAIGANVLRLTITAILASLYGEQVAQGFLHQFSGILVFAFAIICLGCIGGLLRWLFPGKDTGSPSVS